MKFKKILKYILFLLPWFLSSILSSSKYNYYNSLNLPFFAPPKIIFPIVWFVLFILILLILFIRFIQRVIKLIRKRCLLIIYLISCLLFYFLT